MVRSERIWQPVADYERALAGTPVHSSAFNQSRQFTYDLLGRLRTDTILAGTSAVANRIYTYNDAGNLRNVDGQTLGMAATAHFTYDAQHRLLTANGPQDYSGAFTYSKAGNIETAHIEMKQLSTGLPDLSRNVRYEYGLVDPQAVDQLIDRDTKAIVGRFHHDLSGNMISRSAGDGRQALRWDGLDHIRMVEGPNGTEVYF
ncbi:hypothetical protein KFU94_32840 [Chloroflexi bacterium TSY]|nr:hypothetical protein [Chloroflexi bacterium TSY]